MSPKIEGGEDPKKLRLSRFFRYGYNIIYDTDPIKDHVTIAT